MSPDDKEEIIAVIKATVNGKIDRLTELMELHNERHEQDMVEVRNHISEVKPYLDSARGVKLLGELGKWVAGVGGSLIIIYLWLAGKI